MTWALSDSSHTLLLFPPPFSRPFLSFSSFISLTPYSLLLPSIYVMQSGQLCPFPLWVCKNTSELALQKKNIPKDKQEGSKDNEAAIILSSKPAKKPSGEIEIKHQSSAPAQEISYPPGNWGIKLFAASKYDTIFVSKDRRYATNHPILH